MPDLTDALPTRDSHHPSLPSLRELHARSLADPDGFFRPVAEELAWFDKAGPVLERSEAPPFGRWFPGWTTNLSYNALDRHLGSGRRNQVAFYWEGEDGSRRALTYFDLYREVNRFASTLRDSGVRKGDRVTIYLPMVPELPIAMLAAVRLGAVHSVVFAGFHAAAVADRIADSGSRVVVTADGGYRRGRVVPLKPVVDEALARPGPVERVVVVRRTGGAVEMREGRDVWYDEAAPRGHPHVPAVPVAGTDPSYILYTSGTTGRPKGATHGTGGYMVWLHYTMRAVFDPHPSDVYWCAADIGWVTGHSYIVYGPLLEGLSSVLYEGAPDYPNPGRWWEIVERYGVSTLYTSPTAIRMHMKFGEEWVRAHDLSSLRLLGSVGEAINPPAWQWYFRHIGHGRTPIVDTWWQTETGGIMVSPQPGLGLVPLKPGSATLPLPGVDIDVVGEEGRPVSAMERGFVVLRSPWPGELLTLWNDEERFRSTYFGRFPGMYYAGDYALRDHEGYLWFLGRADEVLKVSGHRIGTVELEDALGRHPSVAESAVVGKPDPVRGHVPVAFVTLRSTHSPTDGLRQDLLDQMRQAIGPLAVPESLHFVDRLPKTRSGKIMRRVIAAVVEGRPVGDVTTLEDETSVEEARRAYRELAAALRHEKSEPPAARGRGAGRKAPGTP